MRKITLLLLLCLFLTGCGSKEKETIYVPQPESIKIENQETQERFSLYDYYKCPVLLKTQIGDVNLSRYLYKTVEITTIKTPANEISISNYGGNDAYIKINDKSYYSNSYVMPKLAVDNIDFRLEEKFSILETKPEFKINKSGVTYKVLFSENNIPIGFENNNNIISIEETEEIPTVIETYENILPSEISWEIQQIIEQP